MLDKILRFISPFFMNKTEDYSDEYFIYNHLRHLRSWYGFLFRLYYRYLAFYCMALPAKIGKRSKILDIGCGVGVLVSEFRKLGYKAIGVDVNKMALKNSLAPEHCFLVKSTAHLDFPDNYFDLIVSRETLEHISKVEIDDCIKEWGRVGRGKMVHIIAVTERGKSATADPTHVNVKPENWWIKKFRSFGYKSIKNPFRFFFSPFGTSGFMMAVDARVTK